MKRSSIRDNVVQLAALVAAVALGYAFRGWAGAAAGFLLFAVLILLIVRHKMGRAQEIGKAQRAARLASASPRSKTSNDLPAGNDNGANRP